MTAYYNDADPYVAQWLRNLVAAGLLPPGDVDERDIHDVQPSDLRGYTQVHLFAGMGGWPLALSLAGWPASAPVWTGSCPCQPYSAAGKRRGDDDPRNLWPEFRRLLAECRPPTVFGEQVASAAGRAWLAGVRTDLEDLGYGVGAADLCAASLGAPHIRQRLYWVADAEGAESDGFRPFSDRASGGFADAGGLGLARGQRQPRIVGGGAAGGAVGEPSEGLEQPAGIGRGTWRPEPGRRGVVERCGPSGLAHTIGGDIQRFAIAGGESAKTREVEATMGERQWGRSDIGSRSPWANSILTLCRDGKARRIEPGLSPLAHGVPARVGKLRAYGNSIVPPLAAAFIEAYLMRR